MKRVACSVCGSGPVVSRGYCGRHYYRWKRYGDPLGRPVPRKLSGIGGLRVKAGMTQAELAVVVGISASAVCRLERGQRRISLPLALRLSEVLGVPVEELARDVR